MKQAIHILRKDLRRLWPDLAVSLLPLAALSWLDAQRYDFIAGPAEGLLHIVMLVVWAILTARAIQLETPADNLQFWLTRPYSRLSLVAAKAAYVVLAIHIPLAIANMAVIASHGFSPWQSMPAIVGKQMWIAAAWIVPVAATAAASAGLARFLVALVTVVGAAALVNFWPAAQQFPWAEPPVIRGGLAAAAVAVAAALGMALAYGRKAVAWARAAIAIGAVAALAVLAFLPYRADVRLRCMTRASLPQPVHISYDPGGAPMPDVAFGSGNVLVGIPVQMEGVEQDRTPFAAFLPLGVTIESRAAASWRAEMNGAITPRSHGVYLNIWLANADYDRLKQAPVTIRGAFAATVYDNGDPVVVPALARDFDVPGLGRCGASVAPNKLSSEQSPLLKVLCESPAGIGAMSKIALRDAQTGREWKQRLGDAMNYIPYPRLSWLSPIDRKQTFFHLASRASDAPGDSWYVPESVLSHAQIQAAGSVHASCDIIAYTLPDVDLSRWRVPSVKPR